jgi:chromosome segregation ATPase
VSKVVEKSSKFSEMSICEVEQAELSDLLASIAGRNGSVAERIARAARRLRWEYRRTKAHWYGEARRIDQHEMRQAREAASELEAKRQEAAANAELADLRTRLARLETLVSEAANLAGATGDPLRPSLRNDRGAADG